jgi:hypothetical protein
MPSCTLLPLLRTSHVTLFALLLLADLALAASPVKEVPICNLPQPLRVQNYKGGSCVHASTGSDFNWLHEYALQKWWNQTYSSGESYNGLTSKLRKNKIPFYDTANGDVQVLEKCSAERRMATIFYYPSHSINFCGFQDGYAYLLDNNNTGVWIRVQRETFIRNWKGYGGVAVVPLIGSPAPPLPWRK